MEQTNPLPNPAPPQIPVNPPASQPVNIQSSNKPILIVLLVILLIALSSLAIYFIVKSQSKSQIPISSSAPISSPSGQPSPAPSVVDETVGWKTYTNAKYNYQLKYPNDFKVTEETNDKVRISNNLPPDPNCKGGGCNLETPKLSIYFENLNNPGENTMNLDEYANVRRASLLQMFNDQREIKKIKKFGLDTRYIEGQTEGYHNSYFMKPQPNVSFTIEVIFPSREDVPTYKNIADQILSTFRFD